MTRSAAYRLRPATASDAGRLAELCGQLGYPSSAHQLRQRLADILPDGSQAICVAEAPGGEMAGWVHVALRPLLETDRQAEIGGLVVDGAHRRRGLGRRLMVWAEDWARGRGCVVVQLRSNVERQYTPPFYEGIGYTETKMARTFRKEL
jgi:GNAT superfamily N-acetyltransferase